MPLSFARPTAKDSDLVKKSKTAVQRTSIRAGTNVSAAIQNIVEVAKRKLAKYTDEYVIIRTKDELQEYIQACNSFGEAALDTETDGLNPLLVKLVGLCLYVPGRKGAYIPVNHISYVTGAKIKDQLTEEEVADVLKLATCNWIMHNSKFDIRVCKHTLKVDLECYWDTMLAACCIDENESHRLKDLHLKYCNSKDTESLTFDALFNGVTFDKVPISTAYLYAAGDPVKTYELYQYQTTLLNRRVLPGPYNVFRNIEMPIVRVVCDMEDRGVCLDFTKCDKLLKKYTKIKEDAEQKAEHALSKYQKIVTEYKVKNPTAKISNPISLTSPTQLAVLFYDILKLESPDRKSPRGTGEEIIKHFAEGGHEELCNAILSIREVNKLLSTYIEKMPKVALSDGRVHASYNQYGAKTGRFSSNEPNLQNIPSHNKEIRQMFKAQDGYILVGADFSQQEPMVTAHLSNDKKMQEAFINGKDIYSTIAALAFHKSYEDCKEFRPDGTVNPEGKERRTQAKSIVLGILYGRQIPSIAEQLGTTAKEAQAIYDKVIASFPALGQFIEDSQNMARTEGYVTTAWGRRRHLTDMQLEPYEFSYSGNVTNFDPLAFGQNVALDVPKETKENYIKQLDKAYGWQKKNAIIQNALSQGIKIKDNGGFISQAERQCVNARVQGSAADITKLAMIEINNDPVMKELDFHLLIQVHDEVIGECPEENAKQAGERLSYLMRTAPSKVIKLPFGCDCDFTRNWYGEEMEI